MKAKSSFNYIYQFYKNMSKSQKSILTFIVSIISSLYAVLVIAHHNNYSVGFIYILSFSFYFIIFLLIFLLNTKYTYEMFNKNYFLLNRLVSKKQYLKELIKTVCFNNLCVFITNIILVVIGLNLFNTNEIILSDEIFIIKSTYYIIFVIIKVLILTQLLSIINTLLLRIMNAKVLVILNIILYLLPFVLPVQYQNIKSINQIPIFIGSYFSINFYSSFGLEVLCFVIFISFMLFIILILKKYILKYSGDINYEIYND